MNASRRSRSSLQRSVSSNSMRFLLSPGDGACRIRIRVRGVELADRSVVVTGAGSGIGRAFARRVAAERPRAVVVSDLDLSAAQAVADEIGGAPVRADVSRESEG